MAHLGSTLLLAPNVLAFEINFMPIIGRCYLVWLIQRALVAVITEDPCFEV